MPLPEPKASGGTAKRSEAVKGRQSQASHPLSSSGPDSQGPELSSSLTRRRRRRQGSAFLQDQEAGDAAWQASFAQRSVRSTDSPQGLLLQAAAALQRRGSGDAHMQASDSDGLSHEQDEDEDRGHWMRFPSRAGLDIATRAYAPAQHADATAGYGKEAGGLERKRRRMAPGGIAPKAGSCSM